MKIKYVIILEAFIQEVRIRKIYSNLRIIIKAHHIETRTIRPLTSFR